LYAQLRDNSQGVIKITTGAAGRDTAAGAIMVERETKLSGARVSSASTSHTLCSASLHAAAGTGVLAADTRASCFQPSLTVRCFFASLARSAPERPAELRRGGCGARRGDGGG
jgi:hypothetical protein